MNVTSRRPLLGGRIFGRTGAYELILGTIDYAVDPASPHNSIIVDLDVAPRNAAGRVEFSGDVMILRPVDASHGNGITLIDVVNRGGRTVLGTFNLATGGGDLSSPAEVGDGLLLERGYTIVFLGWEFDVATGLKLRVPTAPGIKGIAHGLYVAADTGRPIVFSDLNGYTPVDAGASSTTLTVRKGANGMATAVPRESWQLAGNTVTLAAPAQPGRWYELSYAAVNPPIAGLGFAAVRDVAAWTKSSKNALARSTSVLAYGNSQCGRFLRDFLYEGFNTDETNHQALDAVFANVAGASRI
ncbi:MAG: alpha/beta hydrolase domain-containing protein, partial [bacterium]